MLGLSQIQTFWSQRKNTIHLIKSCRTDQWPNRDARPVSSPFFVCSSRLDLESFLYSPSPSPACRDCLCECLSPSLWSSHCPCRCDGEENAAWEQTCSHHVPGWFLYLYLIYIFTIIKIKITTKWRCGNGWADPFILLPLCYIIFTLYIYIYI